MPRLVLCTPSDVTQEVTDLTVIEAHHAGVTTKRWKAWKASQRGSYGHSDGESDNHNHNHHNNNNNNNNTSGA